MRKNPHAVVLGRKGGKARAKLPAAELSRIGRLGGQPAQYRLIDDRVYRRDARAVWHELQPPYDIKTREAVRRLKSRV